MDKAEIVGLIRDELARLLDVAVDDVLEDEDLLDIGIESSHAMKVIDMLSKAMNIKLNPVVIFEFSTIDELADYLVKKAG
ncbi:MAG: acyl carrier protein [bacterium]|nr:acyl carrier protein [bacterium]